MDAIKPQLDDTAESREHALREVVRLLARQYASEWVHEHRLLHDDSPSR